MSSPHTNLLADYRTAAQEYETLRARAQTLTNTPRSKALSEAVAAAAERRHAIVMEMARTPARTPHDMEALALMLADLLEREAAPMFRQRSGIVAAENLAKGLAALAAETPAGAGNRRSAP